jgi:hypothetical protein
MVNQVLSRILRSEGTIGLIKQQQATNAEMIINFKTANMFGLGEIAGLLQSLGAECPSLGPSRRLLRMHKGGRYRSEADMAIRCSARRVTPFAFVCGFIVR